MTTLGTVLQTARKQLGRSRKQVAAVPRVSVSAVGQWERDTNEITNENLRAVAAYLGIDPMEAFQGRLVWVSEPEELNEVQQVTEPGRLNVGLKDVPELGLAVGGEDADFTFNGQIVDHVRRPPAIAHLANIFAIHVIGTSMSRRYEPGDLVYCGGPAPKPGDDVIIEMHPTPEHPAGKGFIKRLIRRTPSTITVQQFNPEKTIDFDAYEVKALHRVIPYKELLGF